METEEFREHLENHLIPFWNRLKDEENGGFYGYADSVGKPDKKAVKGAILNSRILWFYSSAYLTLKKPELLDMADHACDFLQKYCYDSQSGGVYWSVSFDGSVCDDTKHTYNQAFALYALSAYYRAGRNKKALESARLIYALIEERCRDTEGYLEAFLCDFTPASNEKLSENGVLAERTMNTLLHVLEAYTEFYRIETSKMVGDSIRRILDIFKEKVYCPEKKICQVFFDKAYHPLLDLESFGHNIEASWLIDRACDILGDENYKEAMVPVIKGLAESVYRNAFDRKQNALNNEREGVRIDTQKIWWVQAEAVTGFYNAYRKFPEKKEYLEAAERIWRFIRQYMVDSKSGEWLECVPQSGQPDLGHPLVHPWKCPYHNGRMCMEMMCRLSE
ncbi:MAG: AGE family epimerase/isomerase [Bacteroidales bacterium]|nr:AGE family epimerase/isomerase [Lachnoclostridium sp.]MCM1385580.1 AGE family epimerase/isomerase [Lachnoclostridium sp.]MCM1465581.1 AGE family epimerase/isomerase [Bacteroidales bacterium]